MPARNLEKKDSKSSADRRVTLQETFETLEDLNLAGQIYDQEHELRGMGSSCDVYLARSAGEARGALGSRVPVSRWARQGMK